MEQIVLWIINNVNLGVIVPLCLFIWIIGRHIHNDLKQMKKDSDEKFQQHEQKFQQQELKFQQQTVRIDEMYQLIIRMLERKDK